MSQPGKQLTPEVVDLVVHLKQRYVEKRKAARYVSTRNPTRRTAEGLGLGERTIKRIMAGHARCKPTHQARRPGRPHSSIDIGLQPAVTVISILLGLPILIGMGAAWKAKAEVADLYASQDALELENTNYREATGALTGRGNPPGAATPRAGASS